MVILGVDPGLHGAVAVLRFEGDRVYPNVFDSPKDWISGNRYRHDVRSMTALIWSAAKMAEPEEPVFAVIEHVHAMPLNGGIACFSLGYGFGLWHGICTALGLTIELVSPQRWKADMLDRKGKGASLEKARLLYPDLARHLARKMDDGRAEALLIADWGARLILKRAEDAKKAKAPA